MKKFFAAAAVIAIALFASFPAFAGTYTLQKAGIEFDLPDSWVPAESKLGTMFTSPLGDMVIFFGEVSSEEGLEGAMNVVDEILSAVMTDMEFDEMTEDEHNGIAISSIDGTGKSDGAATFASINIMNTDGEALGLMVSFGEAGADEKNVGDLEPLVGSMKAVK